MKKINHCFTPDSLQSVLSKMVSPTSGKIYKWQKCRIIRINLPSKVQCFCGNYRSSRSQMFLKICVLENFAKLTGKHLCWSLFLMMLQAWGTSTLLKRKKETPAWVFCFFLTSIWLLQPSLGHYQGGTLTQPSPLLTSFLQIRPGGHREPRYIRKNCWILQNNNNNNNNNNIK